MKPTQNIIAPAIAPGIANNGIRKTTDEYGHTVFKIDKVFYTVPKIESEYMDKTEKPPVRMYVCEGNRHFIADTYDRNFKVNKTEVRSKDYRDPSPNYRTAK